MKVTVCLDSGLLPHPEGLCDDVTYDEYFLAGTEPTEFCDVHESRRLGVDERVESLKRLLISADVGSPRAFVIELEDPFATGDDWEGDDSSQGNPLLE